MNPYKLVYQTLKNENINIREDVLLSSYTTLHIGGKAKLFVEVTQKEDIVATLKACQTYGIKYYVLGRGSNVLAFDEGYDGLILLLSAPFSNISLQDDVYVKAQSGATLKDISDFCIAHRLGGFEFACGIPGSAGGGVRMNAGAYDGEMKDIIHEVTYLNERLECITLTKEQLDFSYRHSYFNSHDGIILEVIYKLHQKDADLIQERVNTLMKRRYDNQPMDRYSAGSTFKRPVGNYASALIKQAGLQGYQVNDAQVSTKHAGFLINLSHATSQDFLTLIQIVQTEVKKQSGYELECEIKFLR